ncbi:MAG: pseudouridine synthase [Candidatus Marinimicrobia bacterium]|nr:pseudouridine synthase [Candidatus Neomarinimicrobiota bacterium]|tara:strand:- start:2137 stop:2841 length:705 start_codon:yes stop_codon:yes gene_type:complete
MRLNKFLSRAGIASRRRADELIQIATTTVNGSVCLDPAYNVQKGDIVRYDNRIVKLENQFITILLNKPLGVITTVKDTHNRKTVMDLVNVSTRIFPIGRLDKNTSGAILLTNDGDLHQYLSHPKNKVEKDYEVVIEGLISDSQKQKLKKGIYIGYGEYGKAEILSQIKLKKRSTVILRLTQGKKREIRRIFLRLKIRLISIIRIRISGLSLGKLKIGKFRILNETEVKSLKKKH